MKGLSKSRYTAFCQCPKNLWLKIFKPEEATEDEGQQARFERGNQIGDLAMGLFGDFKEVTSRQEDGSMDLQKMIALTKQYMDEGVENICEASFSCEGGYCAVDILRKDGDGWAIYEVKSTSFPKFNGQESKLEKYAPDFAYQKWVLTQCGVNVTGTYLVCLNSDYVRLGELDIQQLFVINDMKEMVENEYLKVQARVGHAMKVINSEQEPDMDLSECCMKPYKCAFWDYCKLKHHANAFGVRCLWRTRAWRLHLQEETGLLPSGTRRIRRFAHERYRPYSEHADRGGTDGQGVCQPRRHPQIPRPAFRYISSTSRPCRMPCLDTMELRSMLRSRSSTRCTSRSGKASQLL